MSIPLILWQTWKNKTIPASLASQAGSWPQSNPQLDIRLVDDAECSDFILEHFGSKVHFLYQSLPQNIMRADFWRLAVVYVHGGYYSDLDITCNENISQFIDDGVDLVVMRELNNISNYFFGATPRHPAIKNALDMMIVESQRVVDKETQSFGMHPLHASVREYFNIIDTDYVSDDKVQYLIDSELRNSNTLIHSIASLAQADDYESWRDAANRMNVARVDANDVLFFTTFNRNGYDLYGREWVRTFVSVANYYNKFRAKIYFEGFEPDVQHPSIEWVRYEEAIPQHAAWKEDYLQRSPHGDYVRTMTVRFSHKAFVIQHALENNTNDYVIWLDGDCIFKPAMYGIFPQDVLGDNLLACQVEHNHDLNHVESGILIFNGKHSDKQKFINEFRRWYEVDNIVEMGQPYDGFIVFKTLLTTQVAYVDLNEGYGKGGIQSDPTMTFCHPTLQEKFIHNIGWTGKTHYTTWNDVFDKDMVYQKMQRILFGADVDMVEKKKHAFSALESLSKLRDL